MSCLSGRHYGNAHFLLDSGLCREQVTTRIVLSCDVSPHISDGLSMSLAFSVARPETPKSEAKCRQWDLGAQKATPVRPGAEPWLQAVSE